MPRKRKIRSARVAPIAKKSSNVAHAVQELANPNYLRIPLKTPQIVVGRPAGATVTGLVPVIVGLLLALAGCADRGAPDSRPGVQARVTAAVETDPVPNDGDAADDPAIWVHPKDPAKSVILGTDKRGGLALYDLAGKQIQYLPAGDFDNVDLRTGFPLGGRQVTIVTAGNRRDNSIAVYRLDEATRRLVEVAARKLHPGVATYGSCMYHSRRTGRQYTIVTSKTGAVEQWELYEGAGGVDARRVRGLRLGSQTEGCVADDELGALYLSEEARGIWRFGAEPDAGGSGTLVDRTGGSGHLKGDAEGVTIADGTQGRGFLIASSQGDSTFAVYRREAPNQYVGTFEIQSGTVDGVQHTDGIDVTTSSLGAAFTGGVFVAQDGRNPGGNQNFKLVPWPEIARSFSSEPTR
jgi:3-phytase